MWRIGYGIGPEALPKNRWTIIRGSSNLNFFLETKTEGSLKKNDLANTGFYHGTNVGATSFKDVLQN